MVRWSFAVLAFVGLVLSVVAHVAGVLRLPVCGSSAWFGLHVGALVVFGGFVWQLPRSSQRPSLAQLTSAVPVWVVGLGAALLTYTLVNFTAFVSAPTGQARAVSGGYVVEQRGFPARAVSEREFIDTRAWELRGVSGHWMLFFFVPFAYFAFGRRAQAEGN